MAFSNAQAFFTLAPALPITILLWWMGIRGRHALRVRYGEPNLVRRMTGKVSPRSELVSAAYLVLAVTFLIVSLARPVINDSNATVPAGSLSVVITVDVSKSAAVEDYRSAMPPIKSSAGNLIPATEVKGSYGTRLDMTKLFVTEKVLPVIAGNRIGVVTYQGAGFIQERQTLDFAKTKWILQNWLTIGSAPGGGSDISEGLTKAIESLNNKSQTDEEQVIMLFSDGGFTGDEDALSNTISEINQRGIKLIVIGLGTASPKPVPIYDEYGNSTGNVQVSGKAVITTEIDESRLQKIAQMAGGTYYKLNPDGSLTGSSGNQISWPVSRLEPSIQPGTVELYQIPLGLAILIMLIYFGMRTLKNRSNRFATTTSSHREPVQKGIHS